MMEMKRIGHLINTQDNRMTDKPMFCVQVCERIGPIDYEYSCDGMEWHNPQLCESEYGDKPKGEGWEGPWGYKEIWTTVCVCFTEHGCEKHLEMNAHNYRHYQGTRIYAESFYRNPEMEAIRNMLMEASQDD